MGFNWWFGLVPGLGGSYNPIYYASNKTKNKGLVETHSSSINLSGFATLWRVLFLLFFFFIFSILLSVQSLHLLEGWESSRPSPPSPPYLLTLRVPHLWPRLTDPQPGDINEGISRFSDDPTSKRWGRNDGLILVMLALVE